jgi:hypothetical protein
MAGRCRRPGRVADQPAVIRAMAASARQTGQRMQDDFATADYANSAAGSLTPEIGEQRPCPRRIASNVRNPRASQGARGECQANSLLSCRIPRVSCRIPREMSALGCMLPSVTPANVRLSTSHISKLPFPFRPAPAGRLRARRGRSRPPRRHSKADDRPSAAVADPMSASAGAARSAQKRE